MLSKWLTAGQKSDLFRRNVQSGGRHTVASRTGKDGGLPGDIAMDHPDAYEFLTTWMVECKHRASLDMHLGLWRRSGNLHWFLDVAEKQARGSARLYMLVAKENRQPAICLVPHAACIERVEASTLHYHELWNRRAIAFRFDHLLLTPPGPWTVP